MNAQTGLVFLVHLVYMLMLNFSLSCIAFWVKLPTAVSNSNSHCRLCVHQWQHKATSVHSTTYDIM